MLALGMVVNPSEQSHTLRLRLYRGIKCALPGTGVAVVDEGLLLIVDPGYIYRTSFLPR
jgi:hypothetical protein